MDGGAWWAAIHGVTKSRIQLKDFTFTFHFHALEKEMATHSSVLAWRIPGTGEPGRLPSMGSYRVRYDWSDLAAAASIYSFIDCTFGVIHKKSLPALTQKHKNFYLISSCKSFAVLGFEFRLMVHFEFLHIVWGTGQVEKDRYSSVPVPWYKKISLFWTVPILVSKISWPCVCFWTLYAVPITCLSTFMQTQQFFDFSSFIIRRNN